MKYFYLFCSALLLAGCGAKQAEYGSPDQLLRDLIVDERYISADQVAALMIDKDPSLLLIDVRSHAEFDAFTLPGATNMPLPTVLEPENQNLLDCQRFNVVFFSNDDLLAEQAWLANHHNCRESYIMKGGLNEWTATILDPQPPAETAGAEALERYQFRKAVCQYFIGGSEELEPEKFVIQPKAVPVKKTIPLKPKKKAEEEGC